VHLDDARSSLKRLYTALDLVAPVTVTIDWNQPHAARFKAAMDEDFGTPEAVAVLFELATEVNKTRSTELSGLLKALAGCLGLLQLDPRAWLQGRRPAEISVDTQEAGGRSTPLDARLTEAQIDQLIAQRTTAKETRNFADADSIRQQLLVQGIVLKDSANGTTWETAV
jgi:cysteinyl-tRNA synthetase